MREWTVDQVIDFLRRDKWPLTEEQSQQQAKAIEQLKLENESLRDINYYQTESLHLIFKEACNEDLPQREATGIVASITIEKLQSLRARIVELENVLQSERAMLKIALDRLK